MALTEKRKKYLAKWRAKNRDKIRAANARWYKKNHESILKKASLKSSGRTSYHKEWRAKNRQAQREYHLAYYYANKPKLKEQSLARGDDPGARVREWRKKNPGLHRAQEARRDAEKIKATPEWLTKADFRNMSLMYAEAARNKLTVDHIVPLRGKKVCGLHVPWNLRLLTNAENSQKSNSMPPDHECIGTVSVSA